MTRETEDARLKALAEETRKQEADRRGEPEVDANLSDPDILDLADRRAAELAGERDYRDDEHPEREKGDISPYRTEGQPLKFLTADDPLADAATLSGKYSGGGRDR